jgi:ATP-binding cassette subfamily B protein/subfamily B ATP-binding cassette protein MsbA
MKNLFRALRMTLKYRWSLITSFVCSVLVALLWSLNLGAVYPFVEIIMHGHSVHDWANNQQSEIRQKIAELENQIATLDSGLLQAEQDAAEPEAFISSRRLKDGLQFDLAAQQARLEAMNRLIPWIERWAPQDPFQTLLVLMGVLFAGTVIRGLFLMGSMVAVARAGQRMMLDLQNDVFHNVLQMEPSELQVKGTGDLVNRIRGETSLIGQAVMVIFGKTVREPLKMIGCVTGAALVNWRLLLLSVLVCPIAAWLMLKLAKITKRANKKAMEDSAKLLDRLYQALVYMRTVRAYNMEDCERARFQLVAKDVYKKSMRISWLGSMARMNTELFGVAMMTLSVLAGGYLVLNHQTHLFGIRMCSTPMNFGSVMMFFGFLIGIADPLRKMGDVFQMIQSGMVSADRVFPLIDQQPKVTNCESPGSFPPGLLSIEFQNVEFEYEPGTPILKGVNARIAGGSSVAILGQNGCGKSTLVNLIPRFFDPTNCQADRPGRILIGQTDIRHVRIKELRDRVGYVTQTTMLFGDTIAENIAYGRPGASREQVVQAAKQAYAHDFIVALEKGYDTQIGERGGNLSGGQSQRISLARAILKNPDILILDESTSQIDPESKELIDRSLAEFVKGRTTIFITHHLSTVSLVDQIILMKDGRVVDCGTHQQLLGRCEEYRRVRNAGMLEAA